MKYIKKYGRDNNVKRILHFPYSIGGHAWNLSREQRKLGFKSDTIVFKRDWLGHKVDYSLGLEKGLTNLFSNLFKFYLFRLFNALL